LVGEEEHLAVAVALALPLALAAREVDAGKEAAVETEGMAAVNHQIVVVGLQPDRGPALVGGPAVRPAREREAAHARLAVAQTRPVADQAVAAGCRGGLHDAAAPPLMLPELLAGVRCDADHPGAGQQQDLRDAVDRYQLRRAEAPA